MKLNLLSGSKQKRLSKAAAVISIVVGSSSLGIIAGPSVASARCPESGVATASTGNRHAYAEQPYPGTCNNNKYYGAKLKQYWGGNTRSIARYRINSDTVFTDFEKNGKGERSIQFTDRNAYAPAQYCYTVQQYTGYIARYCTNELYHGKF